MLLKNDEDRWVYCMIHTAVVGVKRAGQFRWRASVHRVPHSKFSYEDLRYEHHLLIVLRLAVIVRIAGISGKVASLKAAQGEKKTFKMHPTDRRIP